MVDEQRAYAYCIEDISKIENYDIAMADNDHVWICHHKLEIRPDYRNTVRDLKLMNLYYHRPACELIFMTTEEHSSIHMNGKKHTIEQVKKWRETMIKKNRFANRIPWNKGLKGDPRSVNQFTKKRANEEEDR